MFLLASLLAPAGYSQSGPGWQVWTAADGLPESYVRSLSLGADGRLWIRHGVLERRGHSVLLAETGRQVLDILARESVAVVLMDIQMPEMDGFQATESIGEMEKKSGGHQPIIALTAHAISGDSERCLSRGMDAYLSKPPRAADLERTLDAVTSQAGSPLVR